MKHIVVINGKGRIGKDTLISSVVKAGGFFVCNASSIDPIRNMLNAELQPLDDKKSLPYRAMLSKVKEAVDTYYEAEHGISYTNEYLMRAIRTWSGQAKLFPDKKCILFVHIREGQNIDTFIKEAKKTLTVISDKDTAISTLLVRSNRGLGSYGNPSDDNAENYEYDHTFESNGTKEDDAAAFISMLNKEFFKEKG